MRVQPEYILPGSLVKGGYTYNYGYWYVDAYPNRISMSKTDGPAVTATIFGCGSSSGGGYGVPTYFPDADPTGHIRIRDTKDWGIEFCLRFTSHGSYSSDTIDFELSYWVSWL